MPAAATSHSPAANTCPEVIAVKSVSTTFWRSLSRRATRSIRSTSKPTTAPRRSNWNGAYGRWVQVVSTPLADQAYALDGLAARDGAAGGQE